MTLINISSATGPSESIRTEDVSDSAFIPSYAAWYNPDVVHDIERRALPELTTSASALESSYLKIRNFMVDAYRSRPHEYLSVTLCRRQLAVDVGSIYRVHAFLEQWGLINYHVNTSLSSGGIVHPKGKPSGSFHINSRQQSGSKNKRQCVVCSAECIAGFYGLTKTLPTNNVIICLDCFAAGKLVEGTASADYTFIHTPVSKVREDGLKEWTEEEELKLLEAIELHPDDWAKVSERVGRSKETCILHFLQLDCMGKDGEVECSNTTNANMESISPFSNLENPVIGTVAFLASLVHPKVAAEAAKAAIQSMSSSSDHTNTSKAATVAFSIAAKKAYDMAKEEEQIIEHLRDAIVLTQMKKVELKLAYLKALERNVLEEKAELEKQRMVLFLERVNLKKAIMGMEGRFVKRDTDMDAPLDQSAIVQSL